MKSRLLAISLFLLVAMITGCSADVLFEENFESAASIFTTQFPDIHHDGGADLNYDIYSPGHDSAKCLRWLRHDPGWYYVRTSQNVSSPTGRFSVTMWMNWESTNPYWWQFQLEDSTRLVKYVYLFEGYGGLRNTDWGKLRSLNPDGTFRTLCRMKTGWRQLKIVVDFNNKLFDVYYDDMTAPVATEVPLFNGDNVSPSSSFTPSFYGVTGGVDGITTEGKHSLDDLRIESVPPVTPSSIPPGPTYSLTSTLVSVDVSQATGAIVGLTTSAGRKLIDNANDIYSLQGPTASAFSREARDVVVSSTGDSNSRSLTCANSDLPGVTIVKTYYFDAQGQLVKKVAFSSASMEGFLTHSVRVKLDSAFLQDSYPGGYRYAGDLGGDELTNLRTWNTYASSRDYSAGLGVYRYKVNNRWVLPNLSQPNPDGWDVAALCDYLSNTKSPSSEVKFVSIPGDFTAFDIHTASDPDHAGLFADAKPDWMSQLAVDTMYAATAESNAMHQAVSPLAAVSTIWFLNPPWGNWWGDSDPPLSYHSDVYGMCPSLRAYSPNARFSAYTNWVFDRNSDVYTQHADFGVTDRDGSIVDSGWPSDAGGVPSYFLQILNPTARQYWLDMSADRMQKWSMDFFYADGPGALAEVPDWNLKAVAQSYDWIDFYRDLKTRLKSVKSDAVYFSNGQSPYSDIGYIEWRDGDWQQFAGTTNGWRILARQLLGFKLYEYPGYTWVPTYGHPEAQPGINTYAIAYGWLGHHTYTQYMPWMYAALEYRGVRLVPSAVQQPWWRAENPNFEAYGFIKGDNAIVNVIGHSDETTATVTINRADLGLEPGRKYLCRVLTMNNSGASPVPTTSFNRTVRMLTVDQDAITLTVPVSRGLLTSVVLSKAWVLVEHTGAKRCETGFPENYGVTTTLTSVFGDSYRYKVVSKYAGAVVFFPFGVSSNTVPGATVTQATTDGVFGLRATLGAASTYFFNIRTPTTLAGAKKQAQNTKVLVDNGVVIANSIETGAIFVESEDRACGIKLMTAESRPVGSRVQFYGTFSRVDGEYRMSNVTFVQSNAGTPLEPVCMTTGTIGNDLTETLNYTGVDVSLLLVRLAGSVTSVNTGERVIYVDDGGGLRDGIGGADGILVRLPIGVSMPDPGGFVVVTGIKRTEKHILSAASIVNGTQYAAGTVLYVPSIYVRDSSDIQVIPLSGSLP